MKSLVTVALLVLILFSVPLQGGQYLTEAQKELLLEKSRALGQVSNKERVQIVSKEPAQTANGNQLNSSKSRKTNSRYLGVINEPPTPRAPAVTSYSRAQHQDSQSTLKIVDESFPAYSNRSVQQYQQPASNSLDNRAASGDQRLAATAKSRRPGRQDQESAKASRKSNWSGFFKRVSQVAGQVANGLIQVGNGLNQTNSQPSTSYPRPKYQPYSQPNNQSFNTNYRVGNHAFGPNSHTWTVGNQTFGTIGNQDIRAFSTGDLTVGRIGNQSFRQQSFGNTSMIKSGNSKVICNHIGNQTICK